MNPKDAMTSRERVATTFAYREPDRVPLWVGASTEFWDKAKAALNLDDEGLRLRLRDDFRRIDATYIGSKLTPLTPGAVSRTPFGIDREGLGYGQPCRHPLAGATLDQIRDYPWPKPEWYDPAPIADDIRRHGGRYCLLLGPWSPFFHDLVDMVGMEDMYYLMYDRPATIDAILGHITDFYAGVARRNFESVAALADVFFIGNDFGSTNGPLMSPEQFRRFIMPHLGRLIDLGHQFGLKVMLHCCGGIEPLLPILIEAGLDAIHAVQPSCAGMDLKTLKARYGRQIVFNGAIDSHHILIEGTPAFIRDKTREVLDIMKPGGGYIAGASHDWILEETPLENMLAMVDTIVEHGRY